MLLDHGPTPRIYPGLPGLCAVEAAVAAMAEAGIEARGSVFTKPEVVAFILDLAGYTTDKPLHEFRLLEPSMGQGDFLIPAIDRLLTSYRNQSRGKYNSVSDLGRCIQGVELHQSSYDACRSKVIHTLQAKDISASNARDLADRWLRQGDFLLEPFEEAFTYVIGNPPYVRQELIPDALMAEYRRRFSTIYDRADIYIPFIERSLSLLAPGGTLGFICADRWMKNRYGGPLRRYIADGFQLKCFVDMVGTSAFTSDVIAYPAIIVLDRGKSGPTRVASSPKIESASLQKLSTAMTARKIQKNSGVTEVLNVARDAEPWMLEAPDLLGIVRRLEENFPTIEETGCKVGIGVATGADKVFIAPFDELDVESDRKLPLATTRDILSGRVEWRGLGVINPFADDGKLVDLNRYPKLARYLQLHGTAIKARHVSQKNPDGWFRTIDRIYPQLTRVPKLLVPDIKGEAHVVYEAGHLYPHHNLYFVTTGSWDIHALQGVLLSDVTRAFISLYSTKMRGGYFRFQAQYLRRLRLPQWRDVPSPLRSQLIAAAKALDIDSCNNATAALYQITSSEKKALLRASKTARHAT